MSSIHPDKTTAERLAGLVKGRARASTSRPAPAMARWSTTRRSAAPLVLNNRSFTEVTDIICGYAENKPGRWWLPPSASPRRSPASAAC
jgi:hypothetical protein